VIAFSVSSIIKNRSIICALARQRLPSDDEGVLPTALTGRIPRLILVRMKIELILYPGFFRRGEMGKERGE